jgi:hypothetical protein
MTECPVTKDRLYFNGDPVKDGVLDSRMVKSVYYCFVLIVI